MTKPVMKKKGDVTISTVILIVLGLVVLVMMIIGFTKGWDVIFKPFERAPSELQTFAKACEVYAQGSLRIDFCSYNLIAGKIMNCRDPTVIQSLKGAGINTDLGSLNCDDVSFKIPVQRDACTDLAPGKNNTLILDKDGYKTCEEILGFVGPPAP